MFRNRSVNTHQFAMVPRADIPRATFSMQKTYKTTLDPSFLVPVFCEEILPGDTFKVSMTAFARMSTPIFPIMDNMYMDSFFFFVPNRLVWTNWVKFMGEQEDPDDSISFVIPTLECPAGGFEFDSLYNYFGLPCVGQVQGGRTYECNVLPLRAYNLIYNQWFRDENLVDPVVIRKGDSGDLVADFNLLRRGKRHDYFTSCLPWPQKGGVSVPLPLGTSAPILAGDAENVAGSAFAMRFRKLDGNVPGETILGTRGGLGVDPDVSSMGSPTPDYTTGSTLYPSNLYADLSAATAATINQLRQSFQIQKLLERDARGGTRYTELVRAHFGVISPDARLQRPEYLGGGTTPLIINPVAQTSATAVSGSDTPLGNLAAIGTLLANKHGFTQSFTEHGFVIGLVSLRADLTYQQGLRRMWSRSTRYDYYFPAFAMLGEQAVLKKEIYCGTSEDEDVFGYQERWAEYRYSPSQITGYFNSRAPTPLDAWHLSQEFVGGAPTLGEDFIQENVPLNRVVAVDAPFQSFLFDSFFDMRVTRPLPLYSVPGMIDHF